MKLCVIGAGAMGCLVGGLVQRGGHEVSYVARGRQLQALQAKGLSLRTEGDAWQSNVTATDVPEKLDKQDVLLLTTKAYQLPDIAPMLKPLLGPDTIIVPAINGLPWWYFYKHGGALEGRQLKSVDPDGILAKHIPVERIVGCVNYLAGTLTSPGEVHYVPLLKGRMFVGEPDGSQSARLKMLTAMLADAGLEPVASEPIRYSVWHKLWGNIAFNPLGALTGGTMDEIAEGYRDTDLVSAVMNEARTIADRLGIELHQTTKQRVEMAAKLKGHRTSMLMDIEQGRPTEIEAIVGAVREIALWFELTTPYLNALYSLVKLKEVFYKPAGSGQR